MRVLLTVVIATACVVCLGAGAAGGQPTGGFDVGIGVDMGPTKRTEILEGSSRTRGVTRFRVRWTSGVTARVRRSAKSQIFADYVLTTNDGTRHRGSLRIPAGRAGGRITLEASAPMPVVARLRVGTRPSLVVKGLAPGTTDVDVVTVGSGRDVIRATSPCIRNMRQVRGSAALSFADGITPTYGAETNFPVGC